MKTLTGQIVDFVATAKANGACTVYAKLPRYHGLVANNKVVQIRNKRAYAEYVDELGNIVVLCNDLIVRQFTHAEYDDVILGKNDRYHVIMRFDKNQGVRAGTHAYLDVKGRMQWSKATATKHLNDVKNDVGYNSHYDHFALELA
jgi:hypothetical protein